MVQDEMDVIAKENSTGKVYMSGFDKQGRPVMVMRPKNENTMDHDGNIKHITYQVQPPIATSRHDVTTALVGNRPDFSKNGLSFAADDATQRTVLLYTVVVVKQTVNEDRMRVLYVLLL